MRLKRVKIFGFKTFADKTEFDVDGDLIAVVGSNGCGKSNIVDAILWGLGEGNARHLRAQTGTDVIFNGSSKRKPLGFAEVHLLFDNEDGALPVPTPEVTISRRLTRSGDSEYAINRQSCRLRDVLDLLADSGLGRAGYAIVGQKEIDQALAASAEDRRAWVDEAAGVQRYRARKIESLRRLASARDHLSRIRDILNEIEQQREPLREEAEVAKRYKQAVGSLREVESGLLVVEVAKAAQEVAELEAKIKRAAEIADEEYKRAEELERKLEQIGRQISTLESEMDSLRATQQGALTMLERADANLKLGEQRLASFDEIESNLGEEAEHSKKRLDDLVAEIEILKVEFETENEAFEKLSEEMVGAGEEASKLKGALDAIESRLMEARRLQTDKLRIEAEQAHRKSRIKEIKREIEGIESNLPDIQKAAEEAKAEFEAIHGKYTGAEQEIEALITASREQQRAEEHEGHSVRKLLSDRAILDGRRRGIEATIETHEGLAQGPRAVVEAAERGLLEGEFVPVGEAIEVDKEFAVAIETALGASMNDLITDDEHQAKRAVHFLKEHRAGRATFQPIPLMRPMQPSPELRRLLDQPDVVGTAASLVQCEPRHRPVIDSLLGRVVVVEDLDAALKLAKTSGWSRMVTIEGEVVHHSGAVTGGHHQKQSYGLVQRKADLAEIEKQIDELDKQIRALEKAAAKRHSEADERRTKIQTMRESLAPLKEESDEARRWMLSVTEELTSTEKAANRLKTELEHLQNVTFENVEEIDIDALEAERDQALKVFAAKSADAEQGETRIREAEQRRHAASERLKSAQFRLAHAQDTEQIRTRKMGNLEPERLRVKGEIEQAKQQLQKTGELKEDTDQRLHHAAERKRDLLEQSFTLNEQVKEARANAQATGDAAHQAELNRARADARRAGSAQRLMEEYGLSEDEAIEQAPSVELPDDASQVVSRLRREIKAMGDVNVGAIEAYERLSERADELGAQKDDVEGGIAEVESSIRELDKLTRERFMTTFTQVQSAFADLFVRLFPGGEGQLQLSDPDSILESGIEIDVQLPGKKKQQLQLLSGGERSLCATAFLFALLKVKPSPLVVLDEVDAPLDGRNVEKFIDLLREFSGSIQFVVITHNPTTIAAAPVWLGVTMSEPGVSTLVPMRVPEQSGPPVALA